MHRITWMDKKDSDEVEAKLGGYNDFPPNMVEVTVDEFLNFIGSYTASIIAFRQAFEKVNGKRNPLGKVTNCHLYIYRHDWSGYMYVDDTPRKFYKFGVCNHAMAADPLKSRMCYHVSRCSKCGYENAVDSSD